MEITNEDARRLMKSLLYVLLDSAEHGTVPVETFADMMELLLKLEEITEAEDD